MQASTIGKDVTMQGLPRNLVPALPALVAMACATAGAPTASYTPNFDFSPPEHNAPGSASVTLALVAPSYPEAQYWPPVAPYTDFRNNLPGDFEELLASRGFSTKGPFPSYDEMVFPDKQGSDLVLVPRLELNMSFSNVAMGSPDLLTGAVAFKGIADISGRVNLQLSESLTGTRMWSKSILVTPVSVPWQSRKRYGKDQPFDGRNILVDGNFLAALGPHIEALYREILRTAWNYLDVKEIQMVKAQSLDVRQRAVTPTTR